MTTYVCSKCGRPIEGWQKGREHEDACLSNAVDNELDQQFRDERKDDGVIRFDAESWVCVFLMPNSDVVAMTSNIVDETVAKMMADGIRERGGHVFQICKAGVLIAALQLIKSKGN